MQLFAPVEGGHACWDCAIPMPAHLTMIQMRILLFVRQYQQDHGQTPTYDEIADAVGMANKTSVGYQIHRLRQMGVVHKPDRQSRAITLTGLPVTFT